MTILITGATGNIGGEVVKHLIEKKLPLRALVRDRSLVSHLEAQRIELAQGDFSQSDTLDAALQGIEKAFLVMPNTPDQVELESNFIDAAQKANVQHIVKLSVMGAGELPSTFQKWHRQIEEHLEASGMKWTHLRPNMLMQNMRWFAQTIAQQGVFYNTVGDVKISHVDARDVAAVAAVCLTQVGHENKSYVLTGSEAISFDEVAEKFVQALNRPVAYVNVTPQELKAARLANGEPEWYLDAELELFACWANGAGSVVTNTIAQITHRPATTYEEFAQYYAQTHTQDFFPTARS
ncbi:NAD(P)-dependent oxidoreductase [Fischerella muscicola CCMEE 5323]|uniref:NAD(P)-dependent oxidoreductase n=1 Tax=Fischerella muscicola CCMEE 5323 TaxID=2019572 RepID=A0A2N6JWA9_FISMU|nr:SDR family oxidoreductase [Fischerella muscicola]PLZ84336.1 NAD(P)-dependent oxidoreductase [Fischerella muscicola CCMEE 5323]